jgi:hypothetical protein
MDKSVFFELGLLLRVFTPLCPCIHGLLSCQERIKGLTDVNLFCYRGKLSQRLRSTHPAVQALT